MIAARTQKMCLDVNFRFLELKTGKICYVMCNSSALEMVHFSDLVCVFLCVCLTICPFIWKSMTGHLSVTVLATVI